MPDRSVMVYADLLNAKMHDHLPICLFLSHDKIV